MPHHNDYNNNNNNNNRGRSNMPLGHQENIMDQAVPPLEQEALSNSGRTYREGNNSYNLNVPHSNPNLWASSQNARSFSSSDNSGSTPPEPVADSPTNWDNGLQALVERALSIQGGGQIAQNVGDRVPAGPFNIAQPFHPLAALQTSADPRQYQGRRDRAEPPRQVFHRHLHPDRAPRVPDIGQQNFWLYRHDPGPAGEVTDAFLDHPYPAAEDYPAIHQNGVAQPNPASSRASFNPSARPWAAQQVQQPPPARASNTWTGFVGSTGGVRAHVPQAPVPHAPVPHAPVPHAPVPHAPVPHSTRHPVHDGSNTPLNAPQFPPQGSSNIQPNTPWHAPSTGARPSNAAQGPPDGPSIGLSNAPQHSVKSATIHPGQPGVFLESNAGLGVPSTGGPVPPACGGVGVQANGGISPSQVTGYMVSAGSGIVIPLDGQPGSSSGVPSNAAPGPAPTGFRPMTAVNQPRGVNQHDDPQRDLKLASGISLNYAGDASIPRNQSADIPDHLNCSMWIKHLPADVTYSSLLGSIRGMGRIFAAHINPPNEGHKTAAAKVVFFDLDAAQRFYSMASNPSRRFIVQGMVAEVTRNRIRSAACDVGGNLTRVLVIRGDPRIVNRDSLLRWFGTKFQFDLDEFTTMMHTEEMGEVRVAFGSYRSQAQAAQLALIRSFSVGQPGSPIWSVRFDHDPCS